MKKNIIEENKEIIKYMLIVIIVIIILYSIYSFFIIQTNLDSLEKNLEKNLHEISQKQTEVINEKLEYYVKDVETIRNLYSNLEGYKLEEEIIKFNQVSGNKMIINYTDMSGNIMINGELLEEISNTNFYKKAIEGKEYITSQIGSDKKTYLIYSAPLIKNNEINGVILAWIDIDILDEIINNTILDGFGYFSLLNSENTVLIDNNDSFINQDILEILSQENSIDIISNLEKALNENMSDSIKVKVLGEDKYVSITILNKYNTNIYLLSFVDDNYITQDIQKIGLDLYIALLVTLSIFILGSLYILKEKREHIQKINKIAYIDELTGAFNLNYLKVKTENCIIKNKKNALIYLDIKKFYNITEIFGTENSNKLIINLYKILVEKIGKNIGIIRVSDSKFLVIKQYDDTNEIRLFVKKVNNEISKYSKENNINIEVNISAGVIYNINNMDINKAINNANLAKLMIDNGNEILKEFDDNIKNTEKEKLEIEKDIKEAIENEYFEIHYQPKFDNRTDNIIGAEALVRIKHPEKGLIMPGKFISIAEKEGYISVIDRVILKMVCKDLEKLTNLKIKLMPISVNLSRIELFNNDLIEYIEEQVKLYNINRENIEFEITETLALENFEVFNGILKQLKEKGYKIMIDDFGSGYSSYTSIIKMPIDVIKIDKSFIDEIVYNKINREVVKNIVDLTKILKVEVLAEGVETISQAQILKEMGCNNIQGYVYSKPIEFEKLKELLLKNNEE